jgi:hypothetical protein
VELDLNKMAVEQNISKNSSVIEEEQRAAGWGWRESSGIP